MLPWVLVYEEHYQRYLEKQVRPNDLDSFQIYLKEIGTPSLFFQCPNQRIIQTGVLYKQVPLGTCIRLHTPELYVNAVHQKLYPEKQDKSRRSSSCTIL